MLKILIVDIETTGFLKSGGKVIEIGAVELNLETGDIKPVFNEIYCQDNLTIKEIKDSWIIKNSDLQLNDFLNAKNPDIVKNEFQKLVDFYVDGCTAYNNEFDFTFLESIGIVFGKKLGCPMKISTNICKIPSKNGFRGYKYPNCEEAYKHFFPASKFIEAHRGLDDAKHEAKIVHELYKLGVFKC